MRSTSRRPLRALAAALAVSGGLLIGPLATPGVAVGAGPLPSCKIQDISTSPSGYDDWATTLVDWNLTLGSDYKPPDLVNVRTAGVRGSGYVRQVAFDDLVALNAAATKNGTPLVSWSAYRSYSQQQQLFNGYAGWNSTTKTYSNFKSAITFSARPGHSEHQLGTTIDFVAVGDTGLTSNWEVTRTGAWMAKNAWKYGWLMSYPKGKQSVVCYRYEPWHYRYYGRELAKKIHDSGLTTREYLWKNFTQVDMSTGLPTASSTPLPSASPIVAASSAPTATAEPTTALSAPASTPGPSPADASGVLVDDNGTVGTAMFVGVVVLLLAMVGGYSAWITLKRRRTTATPPRR